MLTLGAIQRLAPACDAAANMVLRCQRRPSEFAIADPAELAMWLAQLRWKAAGSCGWKRTWPIRRSA
jgi:predicted chitinase